MDQLLNSPPEQAQETIWVAGGFFTPYFHLGKAGDEKTLAQYKQNQCMDVYITQFPMEFGYEISDDILKTYIRDTVLSQHKNPIVREERKSVPFFATFQRPIPIDNVNVKVFFCYESIDIIVNSFTLEPCKIGLRYGDRNLFFGDWFREYYPDDIVAPGKHPSEEFKNRYLIYKGFGSVGSAESFLTDSTDSKKRILTTQIYI